MLIVIIALLSCLFLNLFWKFGLKPQLRMRKYRGYQGAQFSPFVPVIGAFKYALDAYEKNGDQNYDAKRLFQNFPGIRLLAFKALGDQSKSNENKNTNKSTEQVQAANTIKYNQYNFNNGYCSLIFNDIGKYPSSSGQELELQLNEFIFYMKSLLKKIFRLGLQKPILTPQAIAKSLIVKRYNFSFSTRKSTSHHLSKSEPDITHQHHPIQLPKLQIYHAKISRSLRQMGDYLSHNKGNIQNFLTHTQLNCQVLIRDIHQINQQLDKKLFIASQPHQFTQEMVLFFETIHKYIQKFHLQDQHKKLQTKFLIILEIIIKLKNLTLFFNFGKPRHSKQLQKVPNVQFIKLKGSQNLQKQYEGLQKMMHLTTAITSYLQTSAISKNLLQKFKKSYHLLNQNKIVLKSLQAHYKQDLGLIIKALQITQWPFFRPLVELMRPSITTNMLIYIPFDKNQKDWDIFKFSEKAIPVRVLYNGNLKQQKQKGLKKENIMFHIHGGGFVALSSNSTQIYSRVWANETKMLVFSIDYRLAPQFPFPVGLQDCKTVYQFILDRVQSIFNISPKNVYIGGDSAGGNLTCSLTALILKNKLRVPSGLFLVYPLLDATAHFYGSRKYLIQDPLLWPSFGDVALKNYVKSQQIENPLISPLLLTDSYVGGTDGQKFPSNWPATYIHVGQKDTFKDQSLLMMQRMLEQNVRCRCFIMQGLYHGYLCTVGIISSSLEAVNHSAKALNQLIQITSRKEN